MSFCARVTRTLQVSDAVAFDCLADQDAWGRWMPRSFALVGASAGRLSRGARFRVRIQGVPFPVDLEVTVAERPRELTWCGGVRGVLYAEHRFVFEAIGDRAVEVRSLETWSGVLAGPVRKLLEPRAERGARAQLSGLAKGVDPIG